MADEFDGEDMFSNSRVRELDNEDFYLKSSHRIAINVSGCTVVLFYMPNSPTSRSMRNLWNRLSNDLANINFCAVNMARRTKIMQAFARVQADPNHDLHQFQIRGAPTIIVYRETFDEGISLPQAFYNGELTYSSLTNYFLTLACTPGYKEYPVIREGVIVADEYYVVDDRDVSNNKYMSNERPALTSMDFVSDQVDFRNVVSNAAFNEQNQFADIPIELEDQRPPNMYNARRFFASDMQNRGSIDDPGVLNFLDFI